MAGIRGLAARMLCSAARRVPAAMLLGLASVTPALGQAADRPSVRAGRLDGQEARPAIDGRVDEEVWSRAEPASSFTQQQPDEGQPASERTEVRILHDQGNVYIGIVCFDSEPDKIVVTQGRRDAELTDTDSVQVILDTFNDHQNAFLFGTNPLGLEHDGQIAAEGQAGACSVPASRRGSVPPAPSAASSSATTRTGTATGPCAPRSRSGAGRRRWRSPSRPCATTAGADRHLGHST